MKLYEIINATPALNKLGNSNMKMTEAYRLQKLLAALQVEIDFYNKHHMELIEANGQIKDDGTFTIDKENQSDFGKSMTELAQTDVEPAFTQMQIAISENIEISANDIGALLPFVEFTEEE
ncbi:MAG: hypothetical protein FWF92_00555 [Oscillospiraceae bacterium]|nr:hypothetical protein [Oscillospiraceae bacterium]